MAITKEYIFSEYEARLMNLTLKEKGADGQVTSTVYPIECLGSVEEESEVRKCERKCRGVTDKVRTFGTGNGAVKVKCHMPWLLYVKIHGMEAPELAEGIYGYGYYSQHPEMACTVDCYNEDGEEKFKAYPRIVASTGPARKIENGAEEVAEVELEFAYMPDENHMGLYEALASELSDDIKSKWMNEFTPALMLAPTA